MEMEKQYYVVAPRPDCIDRLKEGGISDAEVQFRRVIVSITQGGFGLDVIDEQRQAKERFLEYLFLSSGIDLQRREDVFDTYFELEEVDELVDLDRE